MDRKKFVMIGILAVIVTAIVFGVFFMPLHKSRLLTKNLELGERYLTEQDYEAAVVAFSKVIEADPKCVDAYLKMSDAYIGLGDYDSAIEQLELGYAETGDESIHRALLKIRPEIPEESTKLLQGLYKLMEAENYDGAMEYMEEHADTLTDIYYNQMGEVIALFDGNQFQGKIDGTGMVFDVNKEENAERVEAFWGEFKDGAPHGKNAECYWLGREEAEGRYIYKGYFLGEWENGRANGEGYYEEYGSIDGEPSNLVKDIYEGTFQQDVLNGAWTSIWPDGDIFYVTIRDGHETVDGTVYDEEKDEYWKDSENEGGGEMSVHPEYEVWYNPWQELLKRTNE